MAATSAVLAGTTDATRIRLRRDVYDALIEKKCDASTSVGQAEFLGISRATLYRIRSGDPPSISSAMRIADALGVPVDALFELTGEDQ